MNKELAKNKFKIVELEAMIESLMKDVQWKDEQINMLQAELQKMDVEYSKLFDAYQEQAVKIENLTVDLNTVHYAYGSLAELSKNGVIEKKNGFIGIGKKYELKDQLNDKYFTIKSLDTLIAEFNKLYPNKTSQADKKFYFSLKKDFESRGIKEDAFIINLADDLINHVDFTKFITGITQILSNPARV